MNMILDFFYIKENQINHIDDVMPIPRGIGYNSVLLDCTCESYE